MNPNKTETSPAVTTGKRTRKHYTEAFKTEAVAHCERHGGDIHLQARPEIFDFIEVFYNRQRRHTSLGGLSPAAFELINN